MEDENNSTSTPVLCSTGCGFYAGFDGYCSQCHKNLIQKTAASEPTRKSPEPAPIPEATKIEPLVILEPSASKNPTSSTENETENPASKPLETKTEATPSTNAKACGVCRKRLGLMPFQCNCLGYFCSTHRYSNEHNCSFDFQEAGKKQISSANPQIVSSKIERI